MQLAEPVAQSWKAELRLGFERRADRTVLAERRHDGPLVVQKPLYPEGDEVCHAIVVHPPAGIAGGDALELAAGAGVGAHALLTTPGAGKWYRSAGPWASQRLAFDVAGSLEWLPQETIVFDGALAQLETEVRLAGDARYLGWEILCLGRTGSGERFTRGELRLNMRLYRDGKLLWLERGRLEGGGTLLDSPAGLQGKTVCATLVAAPAFPMIDLAAFREVESLSVTQLPGVLVARYLGDSTEEAKCRFQELWKLLRPALFGREARMPRIWST
ncbi:MAG TPA: urease accessory protein UreD [Burkholderiales bacterium]|nr:urease accessory protein UreD [Burkholderiales bacterium]